ncbi:hypothetical protein HDU87_000009 [Geranomyces variabilis]|uniref:Uncharacterized protein n=1 Tax=Geranomyces variabilis TaxID=109894 RepID=A0AAD5TS71_9FUNG|nr:hypothetical protein HDU87_000009 [Geranomyces variabilis]
MSTARVASVPTAILQRPSAATSSTNLAVSTPATASSAPAVAAATGATGGLRNQKAASGKNARSFSGSKGRFHDVFGIETETAVPNNSGSRTNSAKPTAAAVSAATVATTATAQGRPSEPSKRATALSTASPARKGGPSRAAVPDRSASDGLLVLKTPTKADRENRPRAQTTKPDKINHTPVTAKTAAETDNPVPGPVKLQKADTADGVVAKVNGGSEKKRRGGGGKKAKAGACNADDDDRPHQQGQQQQQRSQQQQQQPQQQQQQQTPRPVETPVYFPQSSQRRHLNTMPSRQRRLSAPDLRLQEMTAALAAAASAGLGSARQPQSSPPGKNPLYAGAQFQNSPAASALPMPVFTDRGSKHYPMHPDPTRPATSPSDSTEASSLPNPVLHAPLFRAPNRTASHEGAAGGGRGGGAGGSPSTTPRVRPRSSVDPDSEMFAMDEEPDDLRKKSRHLLSLLTGTPHQAHSSNTSTGAPSDWDNHSNHHHRSTPGPAINHGAGGTGHYPGFPMHHPMHPHHPHFHQPYHVPLHDASIAHGDNNGVNSGGVHSHTGALREFSAPPFANRPMPPRPVSMPPTQAPPPHLFAHQHQGQGPGQVQQHSPPSPPRPAPPQQPAPKQQQQQQQPQEQSVLARIGADLKSILNISGSSQA